MLSRSRFFVACLACCIGCGWVFAQAPLKPTNTNPDRSKEAFITEQDVTSIAFENDGTSTRESTSRVRIQSDAGLQRFGVLTFSYQNSSETVEIDYVRVKKPDGSVIPTPGGDMQDMAAEITRAAPFYSDLREKHLAVKGLSVGDVLELRARWKQTKPLAPGQFWYAYNFSHDSIVLQEQLKISIPRDRPVKWKSANLKPDIREEGPRRVFVWTSSQLERKPPDQEKAEQGTTMYQTTRGQLPPPDVQISSFQSWEEVGRWYGGLQTERAKATPAIRSKANDLTRNASSEDAKLRAIYNYVSTQFRYIGIAFGIGRYQPHPAGEVLDNQYGDCKDKHTLLAALLDAAGVKAYPALINSARRIDPDAPSPGQFDHVISVVPQASGLLWLDTTTEVGPFGYLVTSLRGKQALVIAEDKPPMLATTPSDPPFKGKQRFEITAKLNDDGTLEGKVERVSQGDDLEVLLRTAFRRIPLPQWKDLVQQISYVSGFGGDVSEVTAGSPEKTDEPFRFAYVYKRKDYSDWSNRRISSPLPLIGLPALPDEESTFSHPVWLGAPSEVRLESHLELPKGYAPKLPRDVDLQENFGEYHASYAFKDGVMTTTRRLVVKRREVPVAEFEAYKKFSKAVGDDYSRMVALSSSSREEAPDSWMGEIRALPDSSNPEAARAFDEALQYLKSDPQGAVAVFRRAVQIDPKFTRAWLVLAQIYGFLRQTDAALQAYHKAIEGEPEQPVSYKALGSTLMTLGKFEEALPVWQDLMKVAPDDPAGPAGLGSSLFRLKRYDQAASALESAIRLAPERAGLHLQLGSAYLNAGGEDKALAAFQKVLELDSRPVMFNDIGYTLADAGKSLPLALEYAEKAVRQEEEGSQNVKLSAVQLEDLRRVSRLAAFWDTLGWVHFRLGHLDLAEKYLKAAWTLSLGGVVADHLGQVYEKQGKRQAAVHAYRLALAAFSMPPDRGGSAEAEEVRKRLDRLGVSSAKPRFGLLPGVDELSRLRTIKLPRLTPGTASAEVLLLLGPGPKVLDVKVIGGPEELKSAVDALKRVPIDQPFPDDAPTRLVRRGVLGCYPASGCSLVLMPPDMVRSAD